MTMKQVIKRLTLLGFSMTHGTWGSQSPEAYNVKPDHFIPLFRDVFVGKSVGGYYVTSHIKGKMRRYRCREWFETTVGNIFGGGSTLEQAMLEFEVNFRNKIYNVNR